MRRSGRHSVSAATAMGLILSLCSHASHAQSPTDDDDPTILDVITIMGAGDSAETSYRADSTVGRVAADPKDVPQTVTAVTANRIADQDIRSNLDLLQASPGVVVTSNEGFTSIRGFGANSSLEGTPVGTFIGRTSADLSAFEQVEILKGPAAIFQGNGAFGGMINYSFKRPLDHEALTTRVGFGDPSSKLATVDYSIEPLLDGRLRARFVGSWEDRDLTAHPEGYERQSYFGVAEFDVTDRTTFRVNAWRQKNDSIQGWRTALPAYSDGTLIDFPAGTTLTQDWALYPFRSLWVNAEVEHEINDRWNLKLAYRNGESDHPALRNIASCSGPNAGIGYDRTGIDRDNPDGRACHTLYYWNDWNQYEVIDANLSGSFDAFGRSHDVVIGAIQQRSWFRRAFGLPVDVGDEFIVDIFNPDPHVIDRPEWAITTPFGPKPDPTTEYHLFGRVDIAATDRLTIPIGGRLSWVKSSEGEWTAKGEFTPSIAAVYQINDTVTVYGQYSQMFSVNTGNRGWRPEWTAGEVYDYEDGVLLPNPTGTQKEIGVKADVFGGRALATAAVFEIKEENSAGDDADPDHIASDGFPFMVASGLTRSRGVELELNGEILPGWKIGAGYTYLDAKYVRSELAPGATLAMAPRHSANIWTQYGFESGRLDGLSLGLGLRLRSSFWGDATDEADTNRVKAPGYGIVSAKVGYDFTDSVSATLNVDNLFDRKYYEIAGSRGGGNYHGEGRRVSFALQSRF
ncbi:outer-membrane receptor for ferric coprogen and ferric-rhodotorulic acid [Paracoccus alcaliphilus]|uniref:Outer-membrane receptor for ferric coprogen and ferric-rhodotorulic acid n=2 Tax=Paracoccus alcaliphilus TaxID=34002 RepID=A0A1H8EKE3_9RHOB|nr:outer-membrane receptor for ferric coprogen and ferric-rhodotorulic acid [Paracoccus alcaliphilus]